MSNNEAAAVEPTGDEQTIVGSNPEPHLPEEPRPLARLRDLRPEKDPMGAGSKFARSAARRN